MIEQDERPANQLIEEVENGQNVNDLRVHIGEGQGHPNQSDPAAEDDRKEQDDQLRHQPRKCLFNELSL